MIALLILSILDSTVAGHLDTERRLEEPLPLKDVTRVEVEHSHGELSILPPPPEGEAHAILLLSAAGGSPERERAYLDGFSLAIERDGTVLRISTVLPPGGAAPPDLSCATQLRLWLPRGVAVSAQNRYGKVSIEGRDAEVAVRNHLGPVEIADVKGSVRVGNEYDRVRVSEVEGDVHVEANSEEVVLRRIHGEVRVTNKFGKVHLEDIDGPAWVENRNAPVELIRAIGGVEVKAPFGAVTGTGLKGPVLIQGQNASVKLTDSEGEITVRYRHGDVDVRGVRGRLEISGDFVDTVVRDVEGDLHLITTTSTLDVERVSGDATLEGSTGSMRISDVRGSLRATGKGGLMEVFLGAEAPEASTEPPVVELENHASPIDLYLPENLDCKLTARSTAGVLESDFPGIGLRRDGRLVTGTLTLGRGTVQIRAIGVDGRVHLRRRVETEKDEEPER